MAGDREFEPRSWIAGRRCLATIDRELQKFVVQVSARKASPAQ